MNIQEQFRSWWENVVVSLTKYPQDTEAAQQLVQKILNPIDGKRDDIIEVFVKYYGEEFREQITTRINETIIFTAFSPKTLNEFIKANKLDLKRRGLLETVTGALNKPSGYYVFLCNQEIKEFWGKRLDGLSHDQCMAIFEQTKALARMGKEALEKEISSNSPFALTAIATFKTMGLDITNPQTLNMPEFTSVFEGEMFGRVQGYDICIKLNNSSQGMEMTQESTIAGIMDLLPTDDATKSQFRERFRKFIDGELNSHAYARSYKDVDGNAQTFCCLGMDIDDRVIMHELGHVVQTTITESGQLKLGVNADQNATWLNECLNEYFNSDIMQNYGGNNLGLGHDYAKESRCAYHGVIPLLVPFIEKYKDKLKHCIMSNNPNELIEFMGKANCEELVSIINEFKGCIDSIREWFVKCSGAGCKGFQDIAAYYFGSKTDQAPPFKFEDSQISKTISPYFERASQLYAKLERELQTSHTQGIER